MNRKQFRIIFLLITVFMGGFVGFAVSIGNPLLAVAVVFAGMATLYLCKKNLEDVMEDERILQVSRMASRSALQLVALSFALGAAALIAMRDLHPEYTGFGFFLAYASCGIMVLYTLFYMYYNKQYGA